MYMIPPVFTDQLPPPPVTSTTHMRGLVPIVATRNRTISPSQGVLVMSWGMVVMIKAISRRGGLHVTPPTSAGYVWLDPSFRSRQGVTPRRNPHTLVGQFPGPEFLQLIIQATLST